MLFYFICASAFILLNVRVGRRELVWPFGRRASNPSPAWCYLVSPPWWREKAEGKRRRSRRESRKGGHPCYWLADHRSIGEEEEKKRSAAPYKGLEECHREASLLSTITYYKDVKLRTTQQTAFCVFTAIPVTSELIYVSSTNSTKEEIKKISDKALLTFPIWMMCVIYGRRLDVLLYFTFIYSDHHVVKFPFG